MRRLEEEEARDNDDSDVEDYGDKLADQGSLAGKKRSRVRIGYEDEEEEELEYEYEHEGAQKGGKKEALLAKNGSSPFGDAIKKRQKSTGKQ